MNLTLIDKQNKFYAIKQDKDKMYSQYISVKTELEQEQNKNDDCVCEYNNKIQILQEQMIVYISIIVFVLFLLVIKR